MGKGEEGRGGGGRGGKGERRGSQIGRREGGQGSTIREGE